MLEIVVVTGTGTGVGKTWTAARLVETLRSRAIPVAARKPVQSFDPENDVPDSHILAAASEEPELLVCPEHRSYPVPLAPPMAAAKLHLPPFTVAELATETNMPDDGIVVVEGAGGVRSPIAADGDTIALADALGATSLVLVSEAGLGAVNAVLLASAALAPRPSLLHLNRFDAAEEVHGLNRDWLAKEGLAVSTSIDDLASAVASGWRVG